MRVARGEPDGGDGDGARGAARRAFRQACPNEGCNGFLELVVEVPRLRALDVQGLPLRPGDDAGRHTVRFEAVGPAALIKRGDAQLPLVRRADLQDLGVRPDVLHVCHVAFSWQTAARTAASATRTSSSGSGPSSAARRGPPRPRARRRISEDDHVPVAQIIEITVQSARGACAAPRAGPPDAAYLERCGRGVAAFRRQYQDFLHFRYDTLDRLREQNRTAATTWTCDCASAWAASTRRASGRRS